MDRIAKSMRPRGDGSDAFKGVATGEPETLTPENDAVTFVDVFMQKIRVEDGRIWGVGRVQDGYRVTSFGLC